MDEPDDDDFLVTGRPADDLDETDVAQAAAVRAERAADDAEHSARQAEAAVEVSEDDPLVDTAIRRIEAGADEENPFGAPGRPISRHSPFYYGFFGGLGLALAALLVYALASVRSVLVLIIVSLFLAIGLNPAIEWIMRRGASRRSAVSIVFLGVLGFFVAFAAAVIPPLVSQTDDFVNALPSYLDRLQRNERIAKLDEDYGVIQKAKTYVESGNLGSKAAGGLLGAGRVVVGAIFSTLTILILTLYFTSSLPSIKRSAYRLIPRSRRARVGLLIDEILVRIGGYVGGALGIALIAGFSTFILLEILGVPFALALAMVVAVTDLVPLIGATIGAIVVTTVAFLTSTSDGVVCLIFYVTYQQVENFLLYPRVMRRSVSVPAVATIIAALIGGALMGVVGALLAIPVAAAILLVLDEVVVPRQDTS